MNILTISAIDSSTGGASRVAMDLHHAYRERGHTSRVLAGKKTTADPDIAELKRPLWRKGLSYLMSNDFDFFDGRQILESDTFREADIVHCHNLSGWYFNLPILPILAKLKPVVWTLHDMWAITPRSAHTSSEVVQDGLYELSDPDFYPSTLWNNDLRLGRRKTSILSQAQLHLVTPCKWLEAKVARSHLVETPRTTIYNGIDASTFSGSGRSEFRSSVSPDDAPIVTFVGAPNNPSKGYDVFRLIAASCEHENVRFVTVGGPQHSLQGNVLEIARTGDKKQMADILGASDVVVMPSRFEVFPLLMLEALACGTPVVGYGAGGMSELLDRAPGCQTVPVGDLPALRQAVIASIGRPRAEREAMAPRLREIVVQDFSVDKMAANYLELFDQLISQRSGAA